MKSLTVLFSTCFLMLTGAKVKFEFPEDDELEAEFYEGLEGLYMDEEMYPSHLN